MLYPFPLFLAETTGGAGPVIDLSGVDFTPLTTAITQVVPQVLPVVVGILGIRKALSFMMGCIRGA